MAGYKRDRRNDEVLKILSQAVREIKDPRVCGQIVSITAVEVSGDLKNARVHFSSLSGDTSEIAKGFVSAKGFLRKKIAENLNMRITPDLTFIPDTSISHGAKISQILKEIDLPPEE